MAKKKIEYDDELE